MIDPIEYKLDGNEFKILQFLKGYDVLEMTIQKMADLTGMHKKTANRILFNLEYYGIITIKRYPPKKGTMFNLKSEYKVNDKKEWRI